MTVLTLPGVTLPMPSGELPYIETTALIETFATDLARVYVFDDFARLLFTSPDVCETFTNKPPERSNQAVAKVAVPLAKLRAIYEKIGEALAGLEKAAP